MMPANYYMGAPKDTPWVNPTMTSDVLPSPYVTSVSGSYGAGYEAYIAMDRNATTVWAVPANTNQWWKIYVPEKPLVTALTIKNGSPYGLNAFKFQGCDDNATWIDLYSGNCSNDSNVQSFNIPGYTPYAYLRILCVTGYTANELYVYEITMTGIY